MKEVLEDLKKNVDGIIGSFIIDKNGVVSAQNVPELMTEPIKSVSKTLHQFISVIKATRSVDKLTLDSDNAKLVTIISDGKLLVAITEKDISQRLFKIMSNLAVSELKELSKPQSPSPPSAFPAPLSASESKPVFDTLESTVLEGAQANFTLLDKYGKVIDVKKSNGLGEFNPGDTIEFYIVKTVKQKINVAKYKIKDSQTPLTRPAFDYIKICDLYDQLFSVASKRLLTLIGPKAGARFNEGADVVKKSYPKLFEGIDFTAEGKPEMR
jgi:predicted regulator of Ras-like GTPase activity (Roadblock/LC7/MglB family)